MKLQNLTEADNFEFENWLIRKFEFTERQKKEITKRILNNNMPFYPYVIYRRAIKKKVNPLWRLTIILYPIVYTAIALSLPFNYLIKGVWGYSSLEWFNKWESKIK